MPQTVEVGQQVRYVSHLEFFQGIAVRLKLLTPYRIMGLPAPGLLEAVKIGLVAFLGDFENLVIGAALNISAPADHPAREAVTRAPISSLLACPSHPLPNSLLIHGNNGDEVEAQISAADLCKLIDSTKRAYNEAQFLFGDFNPNGGEIFAADLCIDQRESCASADIESKAVIKEHKAKSTRAMASDCKESSCGYCSCSRKPCSKAAIASSSDSKLKSDMTTFLGNFEINDVLALHVDSEIFSILQCGKLPWVYLGQLACPAFAKCRIATISRNIGVGGSDSRFVLIIIHRG